MPLFGFLLLSMILSVSADGAAQPVEPSAMVATAENLPVPLNGGAQSFELTPGATRDENAVSTPVDVCYKIRAYIFKRDDDHAPELVGSTTCGPRKAQTKDAAWPKAKLVPAN
jgi:hypothetical protein